MAKEHFDYKKDGLGLNQYEYYGFHLKNGRLHIDTKRLKKLDCKGCFPEGLFNTPRNTHYFEPKHKKSCDYAVNILLERLEMLKDDWNYEYKRIIDKITTPEEVRENYRLDQISYTSCSDDYDEIEIEARFAGMRRMSKYNEVVKSIHLQYIQKICAEYFRMLAIVLKKHGSGDLKDFSYRTLIDYVQEKAGNGSVEVNKLYGLEHYKHFDLLNRINNFLKHNTERSYMELKDSPWEKDKDLKVFFRGFVFTDDEVKTKYETGMYAGDWLKITGTFVDEMIGHLEEFSKELCELLYGEDAEEAKWNSDEALKDILEEQILYLVY